ncbi:MAG: hypothetical protein ABI885_20675 [Gammaproteobacteria bacterium]
MKTLNRYAAGQAVLLSSALWLAAIANAGLKEKPPKGKISRTYNVAATPAPSAPPPAANGTKS